MPVRPAWRPPAYAWALLWFAAVAAMYEVAPRRLEGFWLILTPLLILAGVLAVRRLWELPPAATMCAAIALTVFSGAWKQIGLGGLPFDRLLIVIVALQFLLRAPGVANVPRLRVRNVHLLMGVAVFYVLASADAAGTLTTETGFLTLLDQFGFVPFVAFFIAPAVFAGRRERNMLLATLVGVGAYLGLTAIFESLGPHFLVYPRYILNLDTILEGERVHGPFQASTAEGFATFACAVAAVIACTQWRGARARYTAGAVAAVCVFGCFLTLERGVWLGAAAAIVITALVTQNGRRWLLPGALAFALALGGGLIISTSLANKAVNRTQDQRTVWDRQNQIAAGVRMVAAKPLIGFGWGSYTRDDLDYFRQAAAYPMIGYSLNTYTSIGKLLPLHETYLAYAVELGLVGVLLWVAIVLWGIGGAIVGRGLSDLRPWKLGLLALTVCFLMIALVNPYQAPFPVLLLWVWAGVALGQAPLAPRVAREPPVATTLARSRIA